MVYLDNAATTFPKPECVYQAMDETNRKIGVNAGRGSYKAAREASEIIADTKNKIRKVIHADSSAAVVFSSSITFALNQIINGIMWQKGVSVYVSPYEHNAVARTIKKVADEYDLRVCLMPVKEESLEIDIEKLKYEFSKNRPYAVFCTHVSNVTGYILPVKEIFEVAKKHNAITILDSAQSLGLIKVDSKQLDVDIIAFAGHKTLYGPFGIGGFINLSGIELKEYITGGTGSNSLDLDMPTGNESKYEASSSNVVAIAGLNAAITNLDIEANYRHEHDLTEYLINRLKELKPIHMCLPEDLNKHVGIVSFIYEGMSSEDIGTILDEDFDIAVRTGYHCAPYIHDYLKDKESLGTVRIGLGQFNSNKDIDHLVDALKEITEG